MPGMTMIVVAVILVSIVLIAWLVWRPSITATRGGKILAFVALLIFPGLAGGMGVSEHIQHSKTTNFCLSCHVMDDYGKILRVDDRSFIPAIHFQNNLVPRDNACFTCHTDYTMFGDFKAKLRGLRHLYVYYLRTPPTKLALYEPFKNRECLHCHNGARSYEETTPHKEMIEQLASNDMSCLTCHAKIHDVANIDKMKRWKGPEL